MQDARMKAIVYERYGGPEVLSLRDVPVPRPADNDVLVRVRAASIAAGEWHLLTADIWPVRLFWGLLRPRNTILGFDLAGVVEAVGPKAETFRPGDRVFGACPTGKAGALAEFAALPEDRLVAIPDGATFDEAAAIPTSACTALHGLRDHGTIRAGSRVLINGASGGVGTFAVQLAKALGGEVTAVCSTGKVEQARNIGADRVIDYTREDPTAANADYDLILDIVGKWPLAVCKRMLAPGGIYVAVSGGVPRLLMLSAFGGKQMTSVMSEPKPADLHYLRDLLASGALRPVIERRYPLAETPEALRYLGEGHAAGKIVIGI